MLFLEIGPLTFLMVMIFLSKVNNTIPDRFLIFLSCENDFRTIWGHKNVKNRPQNHLNKAYFGNLRRILVIFSAIPLEDQWLEIVSFPQCALRFFIAPLDFDLELFEISIFQTPLGQNLEELWKNWRAHCGNEIISSHWL